MKRRMLGWTALICLAGSPSGADARTATAADIDCTDYCGKKAAERCDDVTSTWCNAYIPTTYTILHLPRIQGSESGRASDQIWPNPGNIC